MEAQGPFPIPCPMHLFHLAVPELYPFIINWLSIIRMANVSQSPVNPLAN